MSNFDLQRLSAPVPYRVIEQDGPVQAILYDNEPFGGKPTQVFAYLGVPAAAEGQLPAMVCVHGGGGKAFKEWVELWVARGYAAIAMDLSGRGIDGERMPSGGPEQTDDVKFSTAVDWPDMWTYHAVCAVLRAHTLVRALGPVDATCCGITGISWGGFLTCIAASVDPRFRCAIPVYGCGFIQDSDVENWMELFAAMTDRQRIHWLAHCDPSSYLRAATLPMLFVSGTNDIYPLDILERSAGLAQGKTARCLRLEMPHGHYAGWEPEEIGLFADQHLAAGEPLPVIRSVTVDGDSAIAEFASDRPICNGHLLYTTCRKPWRERRWQQCPASLTKQAVAATLPADASAVILAIEDDRGAYISSPCLELRPPGMAP